MYVAPKIFGVTVSVNTQPNGLCTLACPACPVGNIGFPKPGKEKMSLGKFREILDILRDRDKVKVRDLWPSNYTEPLLHPEIPSFIQELRNRGVPSYISTNLQSFKNVPEVLAVGPTQFRVSISGWTRETYGRHHGGDVELLKSNVRRLAQIPRKPQTTIFVHFHRWLDNVGEESLVKKFAEDLGFTFTSEWAWWKPPDRLVEALEAGVTLPGMEYLNLDVVLRGRHLKTPCRGIYKHLVIEMDGSVPLCCNMPRVVVGNFFETPLAELQKRKMGHPACVGCHKWGLSAAYFNIDELE